MRVDRETLLRTLQVRYRSRKLTHEYNRVGASSFWPPLPPPRLNYNQYPDTSLDGYSQRFFSAACDFEFPFLRDLAALSESSYTLDFGCGLGRLASAYANYGVTAGHYFGYEPAQAAREWLQYAYSRDTRFTFGGAVTDANSNYVTARGNHKGAQWAFDKHTAAVPPLASLLELLGDAKPNLQFSSSVFTHMWPQDIEGALRTLTQVCRTDAVFVNTWLVLDDHAESALSNGTADRQLPISVGGIRTYSDSNPLVCTAYPIDLMTKIYDIVDHEIVQFLPGSWAGRQNGVTYQDIVVSKRAHIS